MNEWWDVAEVAAKTRRHPVTVRRLLASGEMHGHQTGRKGRWSVTPAAVEAWITGTDGVAACGCRKRLRRVA